MDSDWLFAFVVLVVALMFAAIPFGMYREKQNEGNRRLQHFEICMKYAKDPLQCKQPEVVNGPAVQFVPKESK